MKTKFLTLLLLYCSVLFSQDFKELEKLRKQQVDESTFTKEFYQDGDYFQLQYIEDGQPIYYKTLNIMAAKSTRTNHLNSNGSLGLNLDGQNFTYHVWDGGHALLTHQEFNNRVTVGDGIQTPNNHATHVIGTIGATGVQPQAKGMAPLSTIKSYDWFSDLSEASIEASNGMIISNHSYGFSPSGVPDYYFGAYITNTRSRDLIANANPYYLMVAAAGNDGNTGYNALPLYPTLPQFDKMTGHTLAKNVLAVAATEDAVVADNGDLISVNIAGFSSQGPSDDLRIKPDIAANGVGLYSPISTSVTAYSTYSGTSMASPNTTGTLGLLQQYYKSLYNSYMRAATLKGLVLHTADDAGVPGPDANFGWGLLNAKKAVQVITDNNIFSNIYELNLAQGDTYTLIVESDNVSQLKASISWNDPAGQATIEANVTTPVLVNDLDIRVIKSNEVNFPYQLTSPTTSLKQDNIRDNFERVDVNNASGLYTIQVTHKNTLVNGFQPFSLIITGISQEGLTCNNNVPQGLFASSIGESSANVFWNALPGATYVFRYKMQSSTTWIELPLTVTNYTLTGLTQDTFYEIQVASVCNGNLSAWSALKTFKTLKQCIGDIPTNLQISNVQTTTATLTWNTVDFATYDVSIQAVGSSTINLSSVSANYKDLYALQPETTYSVKVRSKCVSGIISAWSEPILFTTGLPCNIAYPLNLQISNITNTSCYVTWNAVEGATNYRLKLLSNVSGVYLTPFLYSSPTNLQPSTTYTVTIEAQCDNGDYGTISPAITFTTTGDACVPTTPSSITVQNITDTSATVTWVGVNPSYELRWFNLTTGVQSATFTPNPQAVFTGLDPLTSYRVEVKGRCPITGNMSAAIVTLFNTTGTVPPPPPPVCVATVPTNLVISGINTVSWDPINLATYEIEYTRSKGKPNWVRVTSTTNSITLINLQNNQTYKIRVRSKCNTTVSAWSSTINLTFNSSLSIDEVENIYIQDNYIYTNFEYNEIRVYNVLGQLISNTNFVPERVIIVIVKIDDKTFKLINK